MPVEQWSTPLGVWVGAIGTLGLFSLIYRENKFYRLFEHFFIGLAAGFLIAKTTWKEALLPQWWTPLWEQGQWPWIFVAGIGALFYTSYSRKNQWMSRIAIGLLIALYSGQIFQQTASEYLPQVIKTAKTVNPSQIAQTISQMPVDAARPTVHGVLLGNLLFMSIVICVVVYFFFSFEQKNKVVKNTARTGRLMMMFAFGAIFGSTVMARMALLIDRVWFLMHDWLKVQ